MLLDFLPQTRSAALSTKTALCFWRSSEVCQVVERFTHARVREDEVAQERVLLPRLHGRRYGVDDLPGFRPKKRAAQISWVSASATILKSPSA